ncbi:Adaptin ear-binding coat-associated protein 1 [Homalodisca vitripennis]|nr:Adaptin ear-binding coat-associated protein 1 [Homalodisca vitripennis]
MRVPPVEARADVNERKTSLKIVPISKISNSRGADQKYKLNCNGKAIMYRANHVMPRPARIICETTPSIHSPTGMSEHILFAIQHRHLHNRKRRTAFIGVGFSDRSDSFDLNVALQDHFKWVKKSEEIEKEKEDPKPELDLRFKEGETIKINMKITKKDGSEVSSKPKTRPTSGGILPPPPGGVKIAPPPAPSVNSSPSHQPATAKPESWGEFASAGSSAAAAPVTPSNPSWVQF